MPILAHKIKTKNYFKSSLIEFYNAILVIMNNHEVFNPIIYLSEVEVPKLKSTLYKYFPFSRFKDQTKVPLIDLLIEFLLAIDGSLISIFIE